MTDTQQRSIAWGRLAYTVSSVIGASVLTYYFGCELQNTSEIITVIGSVFSILAGVLIAIVSILGDPSMLMDQSWRHSYLASREIQRKLHRKVDIFVLYILILAALFVFAMLTKASPLYVYVQHATFFLTVLGFFASASLPFSLVKIQKDRLDAAIKARAKE